MFTTFNVKSFKSLEDVSVELGHVNVFIGANGSGKSNLLEAMGVLGAAANGRVDDEALLRRGVRPGSPESFETSFKGVPRSEYIEFEASSANARYRIGLYSPEDQPEPVWQFKKELLSEGSNELTDRSALQNLDASSGYAALKVVELQRDAPASLLTKSLQQFVIYSPNTPTLRGLNLDPQSRNPIGLNGGRLADAVEDAFKQFRLIDHNLLEPLFYETFESVLELIDWAGDFDISKPSETPVSKGIPQPTRVLLFRDKYMEGGRDLLSGYDVSEGALYVLFMAVLCFHHDVPPTVAVDNFDHALNPRLARALTRKICEWTLERGDRQLLLTSHNPLVLDGLPLRDDRVRLFTVQRSSKGKTVVRRVTVNEDLLRSAEKGIPLSQQWVMGTFGGVPDI